MTGFEPGQRVKLPFGVAGWVTIDFASPGADGGWSLYVVDDDAAFHKVSLTAEQAEQVRILHQDGRAPSARVLAGMWTRWMFAAATNATSTLLASSPLRPYAHQTNAVYGAMLPQPFL